MNTTTPIQGSETPNLEPLTTPRQFDQLRVLFNTPEPSRQRRARDTAPLPAERIKILQQAVAQEMNHHMDELLEFGNHTDPFFNSFVEYHSRRMHGLQQALTEAFPELSA